MARTEWVPSGGLPKQLQGVECLRIMAGYDKLSAEDCSIPDRCVTRYCEFCKQACHYDPRATLPILGKETLACGTCVNRMLTAEDN